MQEASGIRCDVEVLPSSLQTPRRQDSLIAQPRLVAGSDQPWSIGCALLVVADPPTRSSARWLTNDVEEWLRLIREEGECKPSTWSTINWRSGRICCRHVQCALLHSRVEAKAVELILAALTAGNECEPHALPGAANGRLKTQWI